MLSSNNQDSLGYSYPSNPNYYYNSPPLTIDNSPISSPQILNHHYMSSSQYYVLPPPSIHNSLLAITPSSSPNSILSTSQIRYEVILEAPTAATQKLDEPTLTYLNKGQYYNINLKDKEQFEGEIQSTITISFHDDNYRVGAADYWKFWLAQQKDVNEAKAVEIDMSRSSRINLMEGNQFDRISFRWYGKLGASINLRFNCLSTDFSRIKGVKGIPLRLQIENEQISYTKKNAIEKTFCRIKLFRDKGAERKNKDDAKHIERQLEKLSGQKNVESHPLWIAYSNSTSPITIFTETVPEEKNQSEQQQQQQQVIVPQKPPSSFNPNFHLPPPKPIKRPFNNFMELSNPPLYSPIGIDPTYIPQRRRRVAKLSLLVKFNASNVYRAIYLEHLTLNEFIQKVTQRMDIQKAVTNVFRKNKKDLVVKVDDEVIQDMPEEQDIRIETEQNPDDTINLILNF